MAGIAGNNATIAFAHQTSGRGTPIAGTALTHRTPLSGGNIQPSRVTDQLSETDASRDEGNLYVQQTGVEGTPEIYVRPSVIGPILHAAFGVSNTSDDTTEFTLGNTLPYYTFYREVGGTIFETFADCGVNELTISAEAGQPLTASIDIMGRSATRLASQPGSGFPDVASDTPLNYNNASVKINDAATSKVGSFEFTLTNNLTVQQTDDSVPYDWAPGLRSATLGFDLIFDTLADYAEFHYPNGSGTGTAQSANVGLIEDVEFSFTLGSDNLTLTFPVLAYEEFEVAPDPGGDPIVVSVRARAQRNSDGLVIAEVTYVEPVGGGGGGG